MKKSFLSTKLLLITFFTAFLAHISPTIGHAQDSLSQSFLQDTLLRQTLTDSLFLQDTLQPSPKDTSLIPLSQKGLLKQLKQMERDSIRAVRDSIRKAPRMMETFYFPDSLHYKRIIVWTHDRYRNDPSRSTLDTMMNHTFYDYAFLKNDVGATYLGVAGSATLYHNYFKRQRLPRFDAYDPYLSETFTPETLPFYNVKTPYTELSYAGTFFANRQREETNIEVIHTQNISPEFNFSLAYKRFGGKGMLVNEATDTRSFTIGANYVGKQYIMHGGYIHNKVRRNENGGVADEFWVRDTIIEDIRIVPIHLRKASSEVNNNTFFVTQMYGIPIRLVKSDTLGVGEGTVMFLGHAGTFSTFTRNYSDDISEYDKVAQNFYHNNFFIHPTISRDSIQTRVIDNRFFIRLQPWAKEAIVSKLDGGVGYEILSNYSFSPEHFLTGSKNHLSNILYFYAGASGVFRKYFAWNALGRLDFSGYYQGDFMINGNVRFSAYPIPQGIHLSGSLLMENRTPDRHTQYYYGNHKRWQENFEKITDTKISATLSIPKWKMEAFLGYGLITNIVYYDTLGLPKQSGEVLNVITASLQKNFKVWKFHLDHRALLQFSSNQDVIPLPLVSANFRYYLQINVVQNVLTAQMGADATYHTSYWAPAYDPDTGHFRSQNFRKIGDYPYIDVFVNLTWKRATIFVKYVNATMPWPNGDYFSALHYIRPQKAIKLGMTWPFYLQSN
ncbi:MAG: putative porin [Prevotellaceae bacterium]|jgi:hypothetical protein|nr:putative porin [Prevotellaceae bacterium]